MFIVSNNWHRDDIGSRVPKILLLQVVISQEFVIAVVSEIVKCLKDKMRKPPAQESPNKS